ncbi:unnamed protein product [Owenia fusiformis]|uniref:Uncharacterized protein n=1 Tax=Owenia fusiformis TaxID=6347 RepID=A0A8S4N182_OWEFU|nr:unnamed protein product [Owenia fusiformis]
MFFYIVVGFVVYLVIDWLIRLPKVGGITKKYVLITGCDTGFGNLLAKKLDKMGCNVFAACLTEKGQKDLDDETSTRVDVFHMNVADHQSVVDGANYVKGKLPQGVGLWGLVNNAGLTGALGPSEWLTLEDYNKVFSVNLLGLIDVTTEFQSLIKKAQGRIVNTASIVGRVTIAATVPYCISKYGVESFSDALRFNLWAFKCSVHIIEPGFHKTSITNVDLNVASFRRSYNQAPQEVKDEYGDEFIDAACGMMKEKTEQFLSPKLMDVVNAYSHALFSVYPRNRYQVGSDSKLFFIPLSFMHSAFQDFFFRLLANRDVKPKGALR